MRRIIRIGDRDVEIASDDSYLAQMGPVFEPRMVDLFRALLEPSMTVADVGANIGMTAILFAQLARRVFAFEPSPSTYALLEDNLRTAAVGNVEAFNLGLGDRQQEMTITFDANNRSGGFVSQQLRVGKGHVTESIKVDTLDTVFHDRTPRPDFIKIDVEGFEPFVIRGGRDLIAVMRPTVVLELNHFCLNVMQRVTVPDFFDLLRAVFPVLYAVDADNRAMADLHDPDAAYAVMHEHVVRFRYPSLVAGFDRDVPERLSRLSARS